MKTVHLLLLSFLAAPLFAEVLRIQNLSQADYVDTEVSTNAAIATPDGSRKFTLELSLAPSYTNCAAVSVGCDSAPADAQLSYSEEAFSAGWDSGAWFFASGTLTNRYESSTPLSASRRSLLLQIDIREDDSIRNISITEDGSSAFQEPLSLKVLRAGKWNLVRATSRGLVSPSAAITVKTNPNGIAIIFR